MSRPRSFSLPMSGGASHAPRGARAIVVGGGIAGIAAATVLCERGVQVTLLESEPQLGGRAGGFEHALSDGTTVQMERGFHAFFRQYYNLRALLRRIDPQLSMLTPLPDYPILGPSGQLQSFRGLPRRTPLQIMTLIWRTPYLRLADLRHVNVSAALEMLRYSAPRTYAQFDRISAAEYLDSLNFPPVARRMLFDVFSHSFFNPEPELSAAELLMMFHFYFTGNAEGLLFDVVNRPLTAALWQPFANWLRGRGVQVLTGTRALRVRRARDDAAAFSIEHSAGECSADDLVLALDVSALKQLIAQSPALTALSPLQALELTRPFAVLRLWLDRPLRADRAAFAGTTGVGLLDNISCYERFQDESAAWAARHAGSVVELHAYALPPGVTDAAVRADLIAGLHEFYPETREARILDECWLLRQDCPAFAPGTHKLRPTPATAVPGLTLAGDFVSVPVPCALMERAAISGVLAANSLLARHGVAAEPIQSVPLSGLFAAASDPEAESLGRAVRDRDVDSFKRVGT
jgi:isorenieratene synthase